MLISALCDYYDILAEKGKVLSPGYSKVKIHYLVCLTPDGKIGDIIDWQERNMVEGAKGKAKEVTSPRIVTMMKRSEKPGIDGNVIEHRPLYLFGLNMQEGALTPDDKTGKAKKSHEAFTAKNLAFLEGIDSPVVNAYRNFIENWEPAAETENKFLLGLGKGYGTSGFAFCLSGRPDLLLHEDGQANARWKQELDNADMSGAVVAQCGVTGRREPIARIHDKIKGVPGGLATGNTLVSFKNPAESSYGHEQSYNSNISETAMKKYTEAFNYLLADRRHRAMLGDMAAIHWAASGDDKYDGLVTMLVFDDTMNDEHTDDFLSGLMKDAGQGNIGADRLRAAGNIDPNVDFYIVGLKPNAARLSVKFVYRKKMGEILCNIARHQEDLKISETSRPLSLWRIGKELVSPKSKNEQADPALLSKILEAVIYGRDYPAALLAGIIRRVKTDSDDENNRFIKMNDVRMGVIKGCINRKARLSNQKEEIKLALDKENTNPAYLCGRLFAVMESIQLKAASYSLNRTIRDAYFASASSNPAVVFPKLMRLLQYHLSKIGNPKYANDDIEEIVDGLGNEFPGSLSLVDQGKFMLGYYQQKSSTDQKIKKAQEAK